MKSHPNLDLRSELCLLISLAALTASSLFFHETGNRLLSTGALFGLPVNARALSCDANVIGLTAGFAAVAFAPGRFARLQRSPLFWAIFFIAQELLVALFFLTFHPLGNCAGTLFAQFCSGASLAAFLTGCMGFARYCTFSRFRMLLSLSVVTTVAAAYGVLVMVAVKLPLLASFLTQIALTALGALCFLRVLRFTATSDSDDHAYPSEDLPLSGTARRPLLYFAFILLSYGVVFGFLHVIPLGLHAYQLPRVLPNLFGATAAMALFVATIPKSEPTTALVWNRIYRVSFPFVTLAALLVPYTHADEFISALTLVESAQFFFLALLITGCFVVCRTTGVGYTHAFSTALLLYNLGFLAGSIAAGFIHDWVPLNSNTFGLAGIGVFFLLTLVTFNTNGDKYAKTAWGILPKETPQALYNKRIVERCEELADAHKLTARERETLLLLAQGKRPKEISEIRTVSIATVRTQVQGVYSKLGVHSTDELNQLVQGKGH